MTDQSRVEAVSQAIQRAASENLTYEQIAQAAIEASDAWLASRPVWICPNCTTEEHYPYPTECRGCGDFCPYSERFNQ